MSTPTISDPCRKLHELDAKRTRLLGEINIANGVGTERDYANYQRLMRAIGKPPLDDGDPEWFPDYKAMLNERLVAIENEAEVYRGQCREDRTDSWYMPRMRRLTKPVAAVLALFASAGGRSPVPRCTPGSTTPRPWQATRAGRRPKSTSCRLRWKCCRWSNERIKHNGLGECVRWCPGEELNPELLITNRAA